MLGLLLQLFDIGQGAFDHFNHGRHALGWCAEAHNRSKVKDDKSIEFDKMLVSLSTKFKWGVGISRLPNSS
jgi:hypothetical protein